MKGSNEIESSQDEIVAISCSLRLQSDTSAAANKILPINEKILKKVLSMYSQIVY